MGIWDSIKALPGALTGGSGNALNGGIEDIKGKLTKPFERTSQFGEVDPSGNLGLQAGRAGNFADWGVTNFGRLGREATADREMLRRRAQGQDSLSAEQLRQSLQQTQAQQQSMAAGARPSNAPMAARTAAMQMGQQASGLAGQQAMAGIAERQAAQQALAQMLMQQRQQELQAALGARGQALQGYGMIEDARTRRYGADMGTPTAAESMLGPLARAFAASQGG